MRRAAMASRSSWECTDRSVPLGRNWRTRPFQFSLVPRCQGEWGSQKYTETPVATLKLVWAAISLPWSQVSDRAIWAGRRTMVSARRAATWAAVLLVELDQHAEAGGALHHAGHRAGAAGADDQVAFPMAGNGPVLDLGGPLGDVDHPEILRCAGLSPAVGAAPGSTRTQACRQLFAQLAFGLHEDGLVDRLV